MANDLTEREALSRFIEGLRQSEGAARVIAQYRRDERWVHVAGMIGEMLEKSTQLAVRKFAS